MNSIIFSSQNKITTITSVTWEYTNNGGASYQDLTGNISPTYNGTAFTIRVKSVTPAEATYSQTGTASITNVADTTAQLTITGTNPYTGSYTSPTITITQKTLTFTKSAFAPDPDACDTYGAAGFKLTIVGLVGSDSVNLVALNGSLTTPGTIAPIGDYTQPFFQLNCVANNPATPSPGNPLAISGASSTFYIYYMAVNDAVNNFYWFALNNSNYSTINNNYSTPQTLGYFTNSCGT